MAPNETIVGAGTAIVAEHVLVATVEEASVPWMVIAYVPGEENVVCVVEVLPLPHKKAIGAIPPDAEAVHAILAEEGTPAHETVNAEAAPTNAKGSTTAAPTIAVITLRNVIIICFLLNNVGCTG